MKKIFLTFILFTAVYLYPQDDPVKEYYNNGKLKSEVSYYNGVREGEAKFYYENGNIREERFYTNGKVEGLVRYYNEAGNLIEMANIENGKREGPTSIFDSAGVYITDIYYEHGKKVVEKSHYYDQKPEVIAAEDTSSAEEDKKPAPKQVAKVKKNPTDAMLPPEIEEVNDEIDPAFYLTVEVMPQPVGGEDQIQRKVHYPKEARENGIQGTVKVLAFIDEFGEVKSAEVVEGIGYGCDESARIAVYYTKFKPGMQRGKRVKVQMVIPVEFKL